MIEILKKEDITRLESEWLSRLSAPGVAPPAEPFFVAVKRFPDQLQLGLMGFSRLPPGRRREVLQGRSFRVASANPLQLFDSVLKMYAASEYAQLRALARLGTNLRALTPRTLLLAAAPENKDLKKKPDADAADADATAAAPRDIADPSRVRSLAKRALATSSAEAISRLRSTPFPSEAWWTQVHALVARELDRLRAGRESGLAAARAEREAAERQRLALDQKRVPSVTSREFQEFMRDVAFATERGASKGPVYPSYMRLRGDREVREELRLASSESGARDGCAAAARGAAEQSSLQTHQAIVNAMLQLRVAGRIDSPGLLVMHGTGAGKTILSLCALVACWNVRCDRRGKGTTTTTKAGPIPIFLVSVKSNNNDNGHAKLAELGRRFFPDFEDTFVEDPAAPERRPFALLSTEQCAARIADRLQRGFRHAAAPARLSVLNSRNRVMHTFQTLGNDVRDELYDLDALAPAGGRPPALTAMFVVDEAHYMNLPYNRGDELAKSYARVKELLISRRNPRTTWCMAMTATPGETADQVHQLMMAIARDERFPSPTKSPKPFASRVRGLVSYAQLYGDYSHFARMDPRDICVPLRAHRSYARMFMRRLCRLRQFAELPRVAGSGFCKKAGVGVAKKRKADADAAAAGAAASSLDTDDVRRARFLRTASNFLAMKRRREVPEVASSSGGGNDDEGTSDDRRKSRRATKRPDFYAPHESALAEGDDDDDVAFDGADDPTLLQTQTQTVSFSTSDGTGSYDIFVSPKLALVLRNLLKLPPGKHFVYSSDKATLGVLARLLLNEGYESFGGRQPAPSAVAGMSPGKRFLLLDQITGVKTHLDGLRFMNKNVPLTGAALARRIEGCKAIVNAPENHRGKYVSVVLATTDHFKGVDLNHLKYLHLVDAMTDYQDFVQFVGRGSRYCSHAQWPMSSRKVVLLFYRLSVGNHGGEDDDDADAIEVPEALSPDEHTWRESVRRNEANWGDLEAVLREASVDRYVFEDTIHKNTAEIQKRLRENKCFDAILAERKRAAKAARDERRRRLSSLSPAPDRAIRKADLRARRERQKARIAAAKAAATRTE